MQKLLTNYTKIYNVIKEIKERTPEGERWEFMIKRVWKIYGTEGHRQRESFNKSYTWDFSEGDNKRIIEVENSDKTGTNEYTIIRIIRNTSEECQTELYGQLTDGIFENSRVGRVEEMQEV